MPRPSKPELAKAVENRLAKAKTYNDNFDKMIDYVEDTIDYNNTLVDKAMDSLKLPFGAVMSFATGEVIPVGFHAMNGEEVLNASESEYATQYTRFLLPNPEFDGKTYANVCTYEEYEQMITDYGACPKFAVDSSANKFKFPNVPSEFVSYKKFEELIGVKGNGKTLGITNGTDLGGFILNSGADKQANVMDAVYGQPIGTPRSGTTIATNLSLGITNDVNNSGIVADLKNATKEVEFKKYIFVANVEVGDFEINWDKLQTTLPNKANINMDNLSAIGKENITSFVMPDYDNPIAEKISLENAIETPYTPTQDCYISIRAKSAKSGATNSVNIKDVLKDEFIINIPCYGSTGSDVVAGAYIPKGKEVLLSSSTNGTTNIDRYYSVYPLKGGSN